MPFTANPVLIMVGYVNRRIRELEAAQVESPNPDCAELIDTLKQGLEKMKAGEAGPGFLSELVAKARDNGVA
jgi:hypothetical protein